MCSTLLKPSHLAFSQVFTTVLNSSQLFWTPLSSSQHFLTFLSSFFTSSLTSCHLFPNLLDLFSTFLMYSLTSSHLASPLLKSVHPFSTFLSSSPLFSTLFAILAFFQLLLPRPLTSFHLQPLFLSFHLFPSLSQLISASSQLFSSRLSPLFSILELKVVQMFTFRNSEFLRRHCLVRKMKIRQKKCRENLHHVVVFVCQKMAGNMFKSHVTIFVRMCIKKHILNECVKLYVSTYVRIYDRKHVTTIHFLHCP